MTKSKLETDIFNYHTPEFFINMKNIPDKKSAERQAFVLEERRKCKEGINVNGIYIPGGLYFHLNYYYLQGDDANNKGKKSVFLPTLRDNEWIVFNDYDKAQKESKIYILFGLRQSGKSEMEVSLCLRELSLYKHTEALALFANTPYRDNFVKKIRTAIEYGEKFMIVPNIDKDWSKEEIRFGLTKLDNTIDLRATLFIYNTQEGKRIQIASGKTPSFFLIDEAGASPFRAVYDTVEPALLSDAGNLRCSPMFTLTGGEVEKAKDAENFIKYPSKSKQFTTILSDDVEVGGRFLTGHYRKDCKKPSTISDYLGIKTDSWIDQYPIQVTDFQYAQEKIDAELKEAEKSPDRNTLILKKIFFPQTLDDVFLTESNNRFPIEPIKQRQIWLKDHYHPVYADFYRDINGKVQWKFSNLKPIDKFPVRPSDDKYAPVVIFEHPIPDAPKFTYTIGVDPINKDESYDREVSLFTICVYKRMISPLDEFKNQVVASVAFRPNEISEAHELTLMLAEYYNAIEGVLPEASESSIFQHFFLKRKGQFLANSFDLQTEIAKKPVKGGKKGLPATNTNQKHYMGLLIEGANEEIITITDDGEEIMTYGITREFDYMLLEEYKNYKSKPSGRGVHDGNFDRIIARGCAETLAKYYDVKYPITSYIPTNNRDNNPQRSKSFRTPFGVIEKNSKQFSFDKKKSSPLPFWMRK